MNNATPRKPGPQANDECPSWCTIGHLTASHTHAGDLVQLATPEAAGEPYTAQVRQSPGDPSPRVHIAQGDTWQIALDPRDLDHLLDAFDDLGEGRAMAQLGALLVDVTHEEGSR